MSTDLVARAERADAPTAAAAPAALSIRDLQVDLGGRPVLEGVDLAVRPGHFDALLGPNGAGKTTLLRSVLGLVATRSGEIRVAGQPVARAGRMAIGYVPQRHAFAWDFPITVHDAVLSGRHAARGWLRRKGVEDFRATAEALERVAMGHLADRTVGELSGGQRQRVLVARALALRPMVLLLDEPFTGLDLPTQEILTTLFVDLATEGESLLMTTHDLVHAMHCVDTVHLLRRRIIAEGTPAQLRTSPEPWCETFEVGESAPLLSGLGVR